MYLQESRRNPTGHGGNAKSGWGRGRQGGKWAGPKSTLAGARWPPVTGRDHRAVALLHYRCLSQFHMIVLSAKEKSSYCEK